MKAPPVSRDLGAATWRKASYSNPNNACVEVARPTASLVGIRDSKAPHASRLAITSDAFETFLDLLES